MSTSLPSTERDNVYLRLYMVEVMQSRIFGAVFSAAEHRKSSYDLSRKSLAALMGKDEGVISKLFSRPSNMTLKTLAEVCFALDIELEFALTDKKERGRVFLDVGMRCRHVHPAQRISPHEKPQSVQNGIAWFSSRSKNRTHGKSSTNYRWYVGADVDAEETENYVLASGGPKK